MVVYERLLCPCNALLGKHADLNLMTLGMRMWGKIHPNFGTGFRVTTDSVVLRHEFNGHVGKRDKNVQ